MDNIQFKITLEDLLEETNDRKVQKEPKKDVKELTADDFGLAMSQAMFLTRMGM